MNTQINTSTSPQYLNRREAIRNFGLAGFGLFLGTRMLRAEPTGPEMASLTGVQPGYYRFKLGDIEAVALNDGGFAVPTDHSPFGVGVDVESKREALVAAFVPQDQIRMTFNNLLVRIGGELILVDTGCGPLHGAAGGWLVSQLRAIGVEPNMISGVIITHMHGDHFGGLLDADGNAVFPKAKLFIHNREFEFWSGSEADGMDAVTLANVRRYLNAFDGKWQKVTGGDRLVEGLEIVESFGHTPGHITLRIQSGSEQLYHMVDIAHHHALSFAHPEWKLAWDVQPEVAIRTRQKFMEKASEARTRVIGAHMPFPALGHIRRSGNAFEYLIEPWVVA